MMDYSSSGPLPSEHSTHEDGFLGFEGRDVSDDACADGDVHYDQNYLELFRRAIRGRNQVSQKWIEQHFGAMVLDWVRDHPSGDLARRLRTGEHYVIETFNRFWRISLHHPEFEFKSMADVLYYLRVCLNAAIIGELRSYSQQGESPLRKTLGEKDFCSNDGDKSHGVWKILEEKLTDARKRRLAFLLFHCALRPVEIVRSCPQEFSDVKEVSGIRLEIMELLCQ